MDVEESSLTIYPSVCFTFTDEGKLVCSKWVFAAFRFLVHPLKIFKYFQIAIKSMAKLSSNNSRCITINQTNVLVFDCLQGVSCFSEVCRLVGKTLGNGIAYSENQSLSNTACKCSRIGCPVELDPLVWFTTIPMPPVLMK